LASGEPPAPEWTITRREVLGGLPLRRAQNLLYLIESLAARASERARHALEIHPVEAEVRDRERDFLEAFAAGADPPRRPTIQEIERYASAWAPQIPLDPRLKAATAHLLGAKYRFAYANVPRLRAALALDTDAVKRAHRQLFVDALEQIYQMDPTWVDRARWLPVHMSRWVDSLSPFWTSFALTLTETVGAGILALPIAVALIGPLPALVLLVVLGGTSTLTLALLGEAIGRSEVMRSGTAFYGRFVADYLGVPGSLIATAGLALLELIVLAVYYVGLASVLSHAIGLSAALWPLFV
jgi:hypothetical protein